MALTRPYTKPQIRLAATNPSPVNPRRLNRSSFFGAMLKTIAAAVVKGSARNRQTTAAVRYRCASSLLAGFSNASTASIIRQARPIAKCQIKLRNIAIIVGRFEEPRSCLTKDTAEKVRFSSMAIFPKACGIGKCLAFGSNLFPAIAAKENYETSPVIGHSNGHSRWL